MSCFFTKQQLVTCTTTTLAGIIASEIIVFNNQEIDKDTTKAAFDANGSLTVLDLIGAAKGYVWQATTDQAGNIGSDSNLTALQNATYTHNATLYGYGNTGVDLERFVELTKGNVTIAARTKNGNIMIVGFDSGMRPTSTYKASDNEGLRMFELATYEGEIESWELRQFVGTTATNALRWAELIALT